MSLLFSHVIFFSVSFISSSVGTPSGSYSYHATQASSGPYTHQYTRYTLFHFVFISCFFLLFFFLIKGLFFRVGLLAARTDMGQMFKCFDFIIS